MMNRLRTSNRRAVRVYVSHSIQDMVFARKIRNLLAHRANAEVFISDDLSAGEKWESKLRRELAASDVVVAILSPASVDSSWVLLEIGAAWALEKPIIPVITRRDVLNAIPVSLEGSKVIELTGVESAEDAGRFLEEFEERLGATPVS